MALLQNLADELLVQIVSYLSRSDLSRVSRVSRRINRITTPFLYNEIWLGSCNESSIDLQLFIRTLLTTPGGETLAALVHNLHLAWSCEVMPLYHEDQIHFSSAARGFGFDKLHMTESGQVILLLHLLPHVHTLDVFPPDDSWEFSDFMESLSPLQPITTLPMAFRSLRYWDCTVSTLALLNLLRLPHIRFITMPAPCGMYFTDEEAFIAATTSSTVTHLKIPYARINPTELLTILQTPRALSHFSFYPRSININYNFQAFRTALAPLQSSLTNLVLYYWTTRTLNTHHGGPSTTIGSLRDWPVLRSLHCSLLPILGLGLPGESRDIARVLPVCIRELEILDDQFWTSDDALHEAVVMVRQKKAMLPELKRLVVYSRSGGDTVARERLRRACVDVGVANMDYIVKPFAEYTT